MTYHYDAPGKPTVNKYALDSKTGYIDVSWNKVPYATGYKVLIFNGLNYEEISVGDVLTWSSRNKKLWPTESQINEGEYNLRTDQTGGELAFDPSPVYNNAALYGGAYAGRTNYWVRVKAIFPGGVSPQSQENTFYMPFAKPAVPSVIAYVNTPSEQSGYINLSWEDISGAETYDVYMFNGKDFQKVGSTNENNWTTQDKRIWPTQQQIDGGQYLLKTDQSGTELSLDPTPVYKNANPSSTETKYKFYIIANSSTHGVSPQSDEVSIDFSGTNNSGAYLGMEEYWSGISVPMGTVNAATGNFIMEDEDFSIDGKGPRLGLNRVYNHLSSNIGMFGYGWHSDAEIKLESVDSGNTVTFTDDDATVHTFVKKIDGTYQPPTGVYLTLESNATEYILTSKDQSKAHFSKDTGLLLFIVDGHNNKVEFQYQNGKLTSIVENAVEGGTARKLDFQYDVNGFVDKVIGPGNRIYDYDVSPEGNLLSIVNPEGEKSTFEYDDQNRLSKVYDPNHSTEKPIVTQIKYDESQRVSTVTNPKNKITQLVYENGTRSVIVTEPNGNQTYYEYNAAGNPTKVIEAYDPLQPNNINLNFETKYEYLGNKLVKSWDPKDIGLSPTEEYQYDANGNIISSKDHYGEEKFTYNKNNDVTSFTDTENQTTTIAYDGLNPTSETDETGVVSSVAKYDQYGNITESSDELTSATNFITNSNFEVNINNWTMVPSRDNGQISLVSVPTNERLVLGGKQALKLSTLSTSTASEIGFNSVTQDILVEPDTTYTLSSKIRTNNLNNARAFLNVQMLNGSTHVKWADNRYSSLTGTNPWTERQITFKTPSNVNKVKIFLEIEHRNNTTSGEAWFDTVQLEKADVSSQYNPIINSSFEEGISNWIVSDSSGGSIIEENIDEAFDGKKMLKMTRTSTAQAAIQYRQTFVLNQEESSLNAVTLTGLSKAINVKNTVDNGPNKDYSLWAKVHYVDGTLEDMQAMFPLGTQNWNRSSIYIKPSKAIESIDVYVILRNNNIGTVWFDAIRLLEGNILSKQVYDLNKNYVESSIDELDRKTEKKYDQVGNILEETSPKGIKKQYAYDLMDRLEELSLANLTVVSYDYDNNGNMSTKSIESNIDGKVQTTTFDYNENNQLTKVVDPLQHVTSYTYDDNGNILKTLLPNGNEVESAYDLADRLNKQFYNGQLVFEYTKDKNGNETSIVDYQNQLNRVRTFDTKNRLTKQDILKNETLVGLTTWTYPTNSDKLSSIAFSHNGTSQSTTYEFNKLDQNTVVKNGTGTYRFDYDEKGNVKTYTPANGAGTTYIYDEVGQVASASTGAINPSGDVQSILNEKYEYDLNGNRKRITYADGTSMQFTYDDLDQLRTETLPDGQTNEYRYDGFGNRNYIKIGNQEAVTPTYNLANQMETFGTENINYDENGNRESDKKYDYTWNAADQLIAVTVKGETTFFAEYKYDDDGRRIQKKVNGTITNYIYDGDSLNVLYETNESQQVLRSYVYSVDGQLLALNTHSGTTVTGTYYYHYNPRGDVIALTDGTGNIVAKYEYDSWGNPSTSEERTGIALENPIRYAGYHFDEETGLYYLMARYYHPTHGVFLSLDPDPGDSDDILTQNGYTYANNNPVMMVDPDGHWVWMAVNAGFAAYDGYKAYKAGKNKRQIALAVASNFVKIGYFKKAKRILSLHANKVDDRPATLYKKLDVNGKFLKWGITKHKNPTKRYTKKQIAGGSVIRMRRGSRRDMLKLERRLVERYPGPENREKWAGKRRR